MADGAARQTAWTLLGGDTPPHWSDLTSSTIEADPTPTVREHYAAARDLTVNRQHAGLRRTVRREAAAAGRRVCYFPCMTSTSSLTGMHPSGER